VEKQPNKYDFPAVFRFMESGSEISKACGIL